MDSTTLKVIWLWWLVACLGWLPLQAQHPLFSSDEPLRLTLEADFKAIYKDKGEERDYHLAVLAYVDEVRGDSVRMPVKLKVRGNFRRVTCQFPPLRLNLPKDSTSGTVFEGQDKLKLVTPCGKNANRYEPLVVLEYLVYKSYNLLTDSSFRARLAEVTYVDTRGKYDNMTRMTFFIEPKEHMTERLGGRELEIEHVHPDDADRFLANFMAIFQYMIGNTDWSIPGLHNVVLVATQPGRPPLTVPYDFDWCGAVDAPYAFPNPQLGIQDVRERLFRGFCRTPEEFEAALARFRRQREPILDLYRTSPWLDESSRSRALKYLEEFFDLIEDPKGVQTAFVEGCRTDK